MSPPLSRGVPACSEGPLRLPGEWGAGSSSRAPRQARRETCSETCPDRLSREGKPRSKRWGCERVSKPGGGSCSASTACGAVNSFSACRKAPAPRPQTQALGRPRAPEAPGLRPGGRVRPREAAERSVCRSSARAPPPQPQLSAPTSSCTPRAPRLPLLVLSLALPSARPLGSTLGAWRARVWRPCGNSPLGASPAQALSPTSGRGEGQKAPAGGLQ